MVHLEPEGVLAAVVLGEQRVEVRGEALVEPEVRPVLAGQQVAEPLVRQLVRDQAVGVVLELGDLVVQHRVGHRGGRDVLHPAAELGDAAWAYLAYGYGRPIASLKKAIIRGVLPMNRRAVASSTGLAT